MKWMNELGWRWEEDLVGVCLIFVVFFILKWLYKLLTIFCRCVILNGYIKLNFYLPQMTSTFKMCIWFWACLKNCQHTYKLIKNQKILIWSQLVSTCARLSFSIVHQSSSSLFSHFSPYFSCSFSLTPPILYIFPFSCCLKLHFNLLENF